MPNQYGNRAYWHSAASNARAIADTFNDQAARLAMLEIASKLDSIARRADVTESARSKPLSGLDDFVQ
jgi:hypothetical protein